MIVLALAVGILLATALPAAADPATMIISAVGATGWLAAGIRIAVGVGLSLLGNALQRKSQRDQSSPGIRTEVTLAGDTTPQSFVLGTCATAGHLVAPFYATSSGGGFKNTDRYAIVGLGDLPITGFSRFWVNGTSFTPGSSLVDVSPADDGAWWPNAESRANFRGDGDFPTMNMWFFDGTQTAAFQRLVDRFGDHDERPWTSAMVGRNIPYAVFRYEYDPEFWRGEPEILIEVQGIKLYDPRTGQTAFTENPVVMVWNILRGIDLPGGGTYGLDVDDADLPAAVWEAAMDACDQDVGGNARFRAGYEVYMATAEHGGEAPLDVIDKLLDVCLGEVVDAGGQWLIRIGEPGLAAAMISDEDVLRSKPQELDPFRGLSETFNAVTATYPDADQLWQPVEAPIRIDAAAEAADGERLVAHLDLPACPHSGQVQRLQRAYLKDARRMRRHTITLPPDYGYLMPLDTLEWTSARNGYIAKLFEVGEIATDPRTLCVTLSLREVDPDDYDWQSGFALPTDAPSSEAVIAGKQTLPGLIVEPCSSVDAGGTQRRAGIRIRWTPPLPGVRGVSWEVRLAADDTMILEGSTADVSTGRATLYDGLLPGTDYEVRVDGQSRLIAPSSWIPVTTPDARIRTEDIGLGAIIRDRIADGAVNTAKFAQGIEPVGLVTSGSLPTTKSTQVIFYEGSLYRWNGASYVKSVASADIAGQVQAAQIAGLEASKITGKLTDAQLDAIAAAKLTGQITETQITNGAISTPKLAAGAVVAAKIAAEAVVAEKIAAEAITSEKIRAGAVETAKLAAGAVEASKIAAGAVVAEKIGAGAVEADKIAANAIIAGKIAAGAVSTSELAAGAVSTAKLAAGAVTAQKITVADLAALGIKVVTADIVDAAVDTLKLAGKAVTVPSYAYALEKIDIDDGNWQTISRLFVDRRGFATSLGFSFTLDGHGFSVVDLGLFRRPRGTSVGSEVEIKRFTVNTGPNGRMDHRTILSADLQPAVEKTVFRVKARLANIGGNNRANIWRRYFHAVQYQR
ncbi:phage tail protein [Wenxinia saemankumensis]|uniref:Putative phage tail protein n=1 Tax=Wenxinia saemankumensis TaxID=1447782 RepID=A0A1M6F0E3_9RHOB|nr:phage tail protein [Wenxinia saemankumensis]SHI91162.1 Putative phage tail protein [Wenxinia saemankumensis]